MKTILSSIFVLAITASSWAQSTVEVGGEAMYPKKNIVENAINSKEHTTLVAAVKAAGLVETLQSEGPFTVFAPFNDAFGKLPEGTVESLLKPAAKADLTAVLTYHVVAGNYDFDALAALVKKGKGKAKLKTVQGAELTVATNGPKNLTVTDAKGNTARIVVYDVHQSNGVIQVIDTVLLP